jgi:hypothetical protein
VPIRGDVSQISPPIRILLVCAVGFLGAYMLFLRPKEETIPPAEPAPNTQTSEPAVSSPGKAAEAAQKAVDASDSQLSQEQSVDGVDAGETGATTKAGTKTTPSQSPEAAAAAAGVDLNGIPKPIAKAIRKNKVLVLLFWNGKSADDKAVHKALAGVHRWRGRVAVESVSIKKISRYGGIARGVDVEQSPTVVVADTKLRAETLVGYVDTRTIDQAVVDALRSSGGLFTDAYLKKVDATCVHHGNVLAAIPTGFSNATSVSGVQKDLDARLNRFDRDVRTFISDFNGIKAPKRWAAFKRASVADLNVIAAGTSQVSASLTAKSGPAAMLAAGRRFEGATTATNKQLNERFDREGLFRCGSQF